MRIKGWLQDFRFWECGLFEVDLEFNFGSSRSIDDERCMKVSPCATGYFWKPSKKSVHQFGYPQMSAENINKSQIVFKQTQAKAEKIADKKYMKSLKLNGIKQERYEKSIQNLK